MKKLILPILLFLALHANATHIVGGEFELIHTEGFLYQLNMILYFDDIYGDPRAEDQNVVAYIFSKKTNEIMALVPLQNLGSTFVPYTNIECAIGQLVTRRILYSGTVLLDSLTFNDPAGYYVSWERCCRNNVINNIQFPEATGQTFYLEFPPVVMNGESFINSSPVLFPPLSDYGCVNQYYYVSFGGTDPDGDSLVYSMSHPIAGFSSPQVPLPSPPSPAPYPLVNWNPGISTNNAIPGSPALNISKDGLLSVLPSQTGLFVFSVKCVEFRNGMKIGEVRRDFQMLVIDCPPPGNKPDLVVKEPGSDKYVENPDTIYFATDEEKCLQFVARDKDTLENLRFRVKPVNFTANLNADLSTREGFVKNESDSAIVQFCFQDCPYLFDEPQIVDVIVGDDTCPLPLLDTVRLVVYIEPPPNMPATFDTATTIINYSIREGDIISLNLSGTDPDGDSILFSLLAQNFDTADFHLNFRVINNDQGKIDISLNWDSSCNQYDFNDMQDLSVLLIIDDYDYCNRYQPDSVMINIHVELPPNSAPIITTDLGADSVAVKVLDGISFHVFANDSDGDRLNLVAFGDNFDLEALDFTQIDTSSTGNLIVPFNWSLGCYTADLTNNNEFMVYFIVEDDDKCKIRNADTVMVTFVGLLPDNTTPQIELQNNQIELIAGESVAFDILGFDADNDSVYVYLYDPLNEIENTGAIFTPVNGIGNVKTSFNWQTNCSHLMAGFANGEYPYKLVIRDNKCLVPKSDTVDFTITVKNLEVDFDNVFITNVFTPNSDGFNEFFEVENLPGDNCISQFISVGIYNRFGKEVYFSKDRNFKWSAGNSSAGIYYYNIKYSAHDYKGWLHVLY